MTIQDLEKAIEVYGKLEVISTSTGYLMYSFKNYGWFKTIEEAMNSLPVKEEKPNKRELIITIEGKTGSGKTVTGLLLEKFFLESGAEVTYNEYHPNISQKAIDELLFTSRNHIQKNSKEINYENHKINIISRF